MLTINDLKTGTQFQLDGEPYVVLKFEHTHMGRGGATVRIKIRNLINGKVLERACKEGDKFAEAELERAKASFLYKQNDEYYFMNEETFDQFFLGENQLGLQAKLLKDGQEVQILNFRGNPISVALPPKIDLKVVSAPPGIRGDTAQGSVNKTVMLETGLELQVPLFVKEGDLIRVNTETGEYVERV